MTGLGKLQCRRLGGIWRQHWAAKLVIIQQIATEAAPYPKAGQS